MYISEMDFTAAGSDCPFLPSEGFSRAGFLTRDHRVSVAFPKEPMLPSFSGPLTEPYSLTVAGAVADLHRFPIGLQLPSCTRIVHLIIIVKSCEKAIKREVPLEGVCIVSIL